MKKWLKGALSEFVVVDPEPTNSGNAPATAQKAVPAAGASAASRAPSGAPGQVPVASPAEAKVATPGTPVVGVDVALSTSMQEDLRAAVNASRLPAYGQFQTLVTALQAAIPDTNLRIAAALSTAKASQNIGPEDVVGALDDRIAILEHEKGEFERDMAAETETSIGGTLRQIEQVQADIDKKRKEIQALEEEQNGLRQSVQQAQTEIASAKAAFAAAHAALRAELTQERERIAAHLPTSK